MVPKLLFYYDDEMTATRLKQDLSASGIDCVVQKETKTNSNVLTDNGGFCFAIYVDNKDYIQAKDILKQFNKTRDEEILWCPKCGSEETMRTIIHHKYGPKWLWVFCIIALLLILYFNFKAKSLVLIPGAALLLAIFFCFKGYDVEKYHCNSCGHNFKRY